MEGARKGTGDHVLDSGGVECFDDLGEELVLHLRRLGCARTDEVDGEFGVEHPEPRRMDSYL